MTNNRPAPRALTLAEAKAAPAAWLETRGFYCGDLREAVLPIPGDASAPASRFRRRDGSSFACDNRFYGKTWRCLSGAPLDQEEVIPWP